MTLILNASDWDELHEQAPITCRDDLVLDDFEELTGVPELLGCGYSRAIALLPGVELSFSDFNVHQDFVAKVPVHDHPIQIGVFLSGVLYFDEVHPKLGGDRSYFSGSGISPTVAEIHRAGEHLIGVNIEIDPGVFKALVMEQPHQSEVLKPLFKGEDWKESFYPFVTPAIRAIAQRIWDAPYRGELKRLYLQAKVMELLVIYLDLIADKPKQTRVPGLKPEMIARLHQAKEILTRQLAHPPSLSALARQVGMSDRTLQRGFREVFGTTVFGYLHTLRMEQAEQLLRNRQMRVSEVAHAVGYSHLGHFTEAFKRRFGITPKQCQKGEKGTVMAQM
ncbi:MAG: helix-turn-helix transcriptional regulator [Leptolyngbyaceae cyanobacterium RM1_406_9]|nr:helix-turn-helix transcriptional regulator [Leptolyngbyaceae cyanobacterium RM1_406_9]